jgi:hypothetical protein
MNELNTLAWEMSPLLGKKMPQQQFQQFKNKLQEAYRNRTAEYQDYVDREGTIQMTTFYKFLYNVDLRTSSHEEQFCRKPQELSWTHELNTLGAPQFRYNMNCKLLDTLRSRIRAQWMNQSGQGSAAGKEYNSQSRRGADLIACEFLDGVGISSSCYRCSDASGALKPYLGDVLSEIKHHIWDNNLA